MISSSSVKDCVSCTLLHLVKARLLINYINNMHACSRFPVCYFTKIVSVQVMVLMLQEKVFQIKKKNLQSIFGLISVISVTLYGCYSVLP